MVIGLEWRPPVYHAAVLGDFWENISAFAREQVLLVNTGKINVWNQWNREVSGSVSNIKRVR